MGFRPDPTFDPSPRLAAESPAESFEQPPSPLDCSLPKPDLRKEIAVRGDGNCPRLEVFHHEEITTCRSWFGAFARE
jgi:hypothetical protein